MIPVVGLICKSLSVFFLGAGIIEWALGQPAWMRIDYFFFFQMLFLPFFVLTKNANESVFIKKLITLT